ncbi:Alpha/Beta hydrolase protein [Paraphysoderma sedebokerense]|nr:Alpha/Beta hydrolase protein [Paraphysoderma sedebokerense]
MKAFWLFSWVFILVHIRATISLTAAYNDVESEQSSDSLHVLGKRNALPNLTLADAAFVERAQLVGVVNSIASCHTDLVKTWTKCTRCQKYSETTARSENASTQASKSKSAEGFEIVSYFNMQGDIKQLDSGFVAVQHPVINSKTNATHPLSNSIIIAMPGASSIKDWIDNLKGKSSDLGLPNWDGAKVHHGLLGGFHIVWKQMKDVIKRLNSKYPNYRILVTGYSRSAPIAIIATVFITEQLKISVPLIEAWSFGSPRFVNLRFNQILLNKNIQVYNVMHEGDPLSKLPPKWWGFLHVPQEVYITTRTLDLQTGEELPVNKTIRSKTYLCDKTFGTEDPRCIDRVAKRKSTDIDDHLLFKGWGLEKHLKLGFSYGCGYVGHRP